MFALGLRYLNGSSMAAADGALKREAEWPPHPDRVFLALAAAWFETGEDVAEGDVLRWLEGLPPPAIAASDASRRTAVHSYVPVNDDGHKVGNPKTALAMLKKEGLAYLPQHRSRQPRGFPVAVPHDPTVRLVWQGDLHGRCDALAVLAAKVTHVGHSASLVQAWVEPDCDVQVTWEPAAGPAALRLRVPSAGRLDRLAWRYNRDSEIAWRDLCASIEDAQAELKALKPPPRVPWRDFPDAVLLAPEPETRQHRDYADAKSGDAAAAGRLVAALFEESGLAAIRRLLARAAGDRPTVLVSAHAYERNGFNAIPGALARLIDKHIGLPYDTDIVQSNIVGHTGADGYGRLARQASFEGKVERGREYLMVDDFIGQGGTLANLRGWLEKKGGLVIGAVALAGKPYSAKLNPTEEQIHELKQEHGISFEKWWREHFGHTFDCLTQSEARYLARSPDADTIRDRLAKAVRTGGDGCRLRSLRERRSRVAELKERRATQFPDGEPRASMRPDLGKWHGYARADAEPASSSAAPVSVFDPRAVVLAIEGRRLTLPATLKLTAALRGLLMRECPAQPPPEWFSGHDASGQPTTAPHLALAPLPFVGAGHADGRVMGMALILPRTVTVCDARDVLDPILHSADTGIPRELRLFDGAWFECALELDTRERPPLNLQPSTWTTPSRTWATVTPVVLNRHFKGADRWERAAESVKDACEHIGLPRPSEVLLRQVSLVEGVPHAREFPRVARKRDGGRQSHAHAAIIFKEPIAGPVLVGAGRFRGYGLCRPMDRR
jgi:hypothetical protein